MRVFGVLAAAWICAWGNALGQPPAQPEPATGFTPRPAVAAPRAMAVTANPHATDAALAILRAGGSATDAAIAAALVLNVVEPQSSGIGGGGFLLNFDADTGEVSAWDGRETAPAEVDESLFLEPSGKPMRFYEAAVGGRSVGVPGLLRMLGEAHARHGRLPWASLFAPAIALAEEGFAVSPRLHVLIAQDPFLAEDPAARRLFFEADGRPVGVGQRLRNPELAAVFRTVAREGPQSFYSGDIARDLVAAVAEAPNPGRLSLDDLAAYRAVEREPLCGRYRDHRLCGMPPPSSGAGAVLALLGVLERFRLAELESDSAFVAHLFSEAGRLAYADRDAWYADPRRMTVSPTALLDPAYLAERAALVALTESLGAASPGKPPGTVSEAPAGASAERPATTHVSVVDPEGNAVALTASIENVFGSRRMVRGFFLNNQLTDFSFLPEGREGLHPNRVEPGKRPRSSMSPTLVFDPQGRLFAVTGSPGGSQIINYVAASIVGLVDWALPPDRLLARPHVGSRNGPTEVEDVPAGRALAARLALFGHEPVLRDLTSGLAVIVRGPQGWIGAADPRREGEAAGF